MRILVRAAHSPFQSAQAERASGHRIGNSGNLLFTHSVYLALHTPSNQLDIDFCRPDLVIAEEANERYDAFVLPLANAFRPQFVADLEQYTALISRLRIPCVVVGVGAQAGLDLHDLGGDAIDEVVKAFASAVLDRSPAIGVRGEFTRDYLQRLGFAATEVIGCPSLFLRGAARHVRKVKPALEPDDPIAINIAGKASPDVDAFTRKTLGAYRASVLVAQEEGQVRRWIPAIRELSGNAESGRLRYFTDVPEWLAFMKTRVFSVGGRIHGSIAALLAGVPAFLIAGDARTLELARYHRIPHTTADTISAATHASQLYEATELDAFNAAATGHFERYKAFLEMSGLDHAYAAAPNGAAFETHSGVSTIT